MRRMLLPERASRRAPIAREEIFLKGARWLWILLPVLLSGSILVLVLVFRERMTVRPIPAAAIKQAPYFQKRDPKDLILRNFLKYPDRYILITEESWRLDPATHIATHSVTLKNNATVAYAGIELSFRYESAGGAVLHTQTVSISDPIPASSTRVLKDIRVHEVPAATKSVTTTVAKAVVVQ
jgi:hypothetical protein